jgi:hypothetical protein
MARFATACLLLLLTMLVACAAPAPEPAEAVAARPDAPAEQASATTPAPVATPETPQPNDEARTTRPKPPPLRTGGPHPPERIGDRKPDPNVAPVQVDYSCRTDADCTVKNVGNCCGYYPACVNVDSPTDPEGVQQQCAKEGMVSVCGWAEISSCSCVQGRCQGNTSGPAVQ